MDSVAKSLASKLDRLDALVCNAGLGVGDYNETEDGLDSHMQVNHIAQFHLAMLLLPILQKTPNSRLVLQSSDLHRGPNGDAKFESVEEINTNIGPMKLYNRTKFAQVLFILALKERKEKGQLGFDPDAERGPWLIATHPGGVVTDQQKQAEDAYGTLGKIGVAAVKPFMKDPVDEGCRPALFAATSEDIVKEKIQGAYVCSTCGDHGCDSWFANVVFCRLYLINRSPALLRNRKIRSCRRIFGSLLSRYWPRSWDLCRIRLSMCNGLSQTNSIRHITVLRYVMMTREGVPLLSNDFYSSLDPLRSMFSFNKCIVAVSTCKSGLGRRVFGPR